MRAVYIVALLLLLIPGVGWSQQLKSLAPLKQRALISWNASSGTQNKIWEKFCRQLSRSLKAQPGPGFLASVKCLPETTTPTKTYPWHIHFQETADKLSLTVTYRYEGREHTVRDWTFRTKGVQSLYLSGDLLPLVVARLLGEALPIGWAFAFESENVDLPTGEQVLPLPDNFLVYRLFYSPAEDLWIPNVYARLQKIPKANKTNEEANYTLENVSVPLRPGIAYWVRAVTSSERQENYEKILSDILLDRDVKMPSLSNLEKSKSRSRNLVEDLLGSFRSSYAGVRFGKSVVSSDSLVTKVNMVSVLAEIGGGPLEGLRGYYDIFPEVKRGKDNEEESFVLKRAYLGWAFSFLLPEPFSSVITKVDVQPKFGLLSLKSRFLIDTPQGKTADEFNVKNSYDLAIEGGLEHTNDWVRVRVWTGFGTAHLGLSAKTETKVKSTRGGIDAYFDLFEYGGWDLNLLSFASIEHLGFQKDPNSFDQSSVHVYSISSTLYLAGLGITASW